MTDFRDRIRIMSGPSVLDFAERAGWRQGIARVELRSRIARGDVDDIDCERAMAVIGEAVA